MTTDPMPPLDERRHHPAVVLAHQYSEWLDDQNLLVAEVTADGDPVDERTHDDLIAWFLDSRPDAAWPVVEPTGEVDPVENLAEVLYRTDVEILGNKGEWRHASVVAQNRCRGLARDALAAQRLAIAAQRAAFAEERAVTS